MYKNKNYRSNNYRREKQFMETVGKSDSGMPTQPSASKESYTFQAKAFKDLRYGLIATKADPITEATTASQPYAIVASTNRILGGVYPGTDNLNGNILSQLMISNQSKLVNAFDSGSLTIQMNYLYLNLKDKTNPYAVNTYMGVAINEALSRTNAEMTSQLPFATQTVDVNNNLADADFTNKLYILALYQSMLQNTASVLAKYIQTMSIEKHLIDMGFNREANFTQEIFSLFKKKSLVGKLQALATTLYGEYFDADWYKQINTLTMIPSRKSTSVRDPLLTIIATHVLPNITVKQGTTTLYATSDFAVEVDSTTYDQRQIAEKIITLLDQRSILEWSRRKFNGQDSILTPQAYFNELIAWLDRLAAVMARVSNQMSDLRTYLDVMGKANLNQWKVGTMFDMTAVSKGPIMFNKILHDTFAAYLNSPEKVKFDSDTQRWTMYTTWNEFTGIPDYDQISGGSFLAFSLRTIDPNGLSASDSRLLVPKLFTVTTDSVLFTSRIGFTTTFSYDVMTSTEIKNSHVLSRLIPLNTMDVSARIPKTSLITAGDIPSASSSAFEIMQTVFGYGKIEVATGSFNYAIGRDIISFIDIQVSDINNAMLTFVRSFAPFRVWTLSGERTVGFGNK